MSNHTCLVGLQYGDEGKGSISYYLAPDYDVFIRYQGGGNAGHTIYVGGEKLVTHFLPVGIAKGVDNCGHSPTVILANGMVIDPHSLVKEIEEVSKVLGCDVEQVASWVYISNKAHVITEKAIQKDREREKTEKIGTTQTGVGPTYEAKINRTGTIIQDIIEKTEYSRFIELFGKNITNTELMIHQLHDDGENMFFEGAQGTQLDLDFGQYPFVTSSNCLPTAIGPCTGFSSRFIDTNIGVIKPYTTRVGAGPFVTEMNKKDDEMFRTMASEFGATTGRPRKCGWLDIPALRYAIQIADINEIAVCKMDIIQSMETIKVCVAYMLDDHYIDGVSDFPTGDEWCNVQPIYENWQVKNFADTLVQHIKTNVTILSFGPNSSDKIQLSKKPIWA